MQSAKKRQKGRTGAIQPPGGFAKLPRAWVSDPGFARIRPKHWKVLTYLLGIANWRPSRTMDGTVVPAGGKMVSYRSLAAKCGVSENDVRGALKFFAARSVLTVESHKANTVVRFVDSVTYGEEATDDSRGAHGDISGNSKESHNRSRKENLDGGAQTDSSSFANANDGLRVRTLGKTNNTNGGKHKGRAVRSRPTYSAEFLRFWAPYPKKVGKAEAAEAFNEVMARGDVAVEQLIQAVEEQHNPGGAFYVDDDRYMPHAVSWLLGERWTDEINGGVDWNQV